MNFKNKNSFISAFRDEEVISVKEVAIDYPKSLISLNEAVSSIIQTTKSGKHLFVAGGVLKGSEEVEDANLFNTVFGRDSLVMLGFLRQFKLNQTKDLSLDFTIPSSITFDTLSFLASYQGLEFDASSEQAPGKIFHEFREKHDKIAQQLKEERGWEFPYFGACDTTFYFIKELSIFLLENPASGNVVIDSMIDSNASYSLIEALNKAVNFVKTLIDEKDGLVWYQRANKKGIEIQSWRDSYDAISDSHGNLPNFDKPLVLLDIQLIAIDSLKHFYSLQEKLPNIAGKFLEKLLEKMIHGLNTFLLIDNEKGLFYAMGLQKDINGSITHFDTISSSNLILLKYSFIPLEYKQKILDTCFQPLKVENGIATIEKSANRYHKSGYHTGNVWLFDNILIIFALQEIGESEKAIEITNCIFQIINRTNCYPELVGSFDIPNEVVIDVYDKLDNKVNRTCQPGQPLQGWTIMGMLALVTSLK
jgi:glycogen debranching enzyme